jgi:heme/copper-type cytochrome/quinol oxidase subunit 3
MIKLKNKKAVNLLAGTIIFLIANIVVFGFLFYFLATASTGTVVTEKAYSREIALIIDMLKPGTDVVMDVSALYDASERNGYSGTPVKIDYVTNMVYVQVSRTQGYGYHYFTKLEPGAVSWDDKNKRIEIKV